MISGLQKHRGVNDNLYARVETAGQHKQLVQLA
jgi:hypothetical protein